MIAERKLGIIAGGGEIPLMLINRCKELGQDYFVIAIEGNADKSIFTDEIPHIWIRIGQAGSGFKKLIDEKVKDVVMIGTIKRPGFFDLVPDLRTTAFFTKVGIKSIGDDGLLRALVAEIEADGITVKGIHEVLPEILIKNKILSKAKPSKQANEDIKRAIEIATELGRLDVGQAVIVQQGIVLGVEGIEGTGELIRRCGDYHRKGEGGVLVKVRKPQQDMRIDLPTIGDLTVESAHKAGLQGVCLHAENGLIVNEEKAIKLANKYGMFLMGVDINEYI